MGLIVLIWSIPFYLYGWRVARILSFPAAFLIFCIPLNFLDSLTFPLRIMVTIVTSSILNGLGIEVARSGSVITAVNGSFNFNIDDPCSGLRSLIALTAITAVYSYVTMRTFIRKWLLFAASVPIAVIGNICRILTIGLVAQTFGQKVATGLYHDYSGYIFFPVAMGLMLLAGWFFNLEFKQVWTNFKDQVKKDRERQAEARKTNAPTEGL
jgi:exosortase